jgi:hypothetical protein
MNPLITVILFFAIAFSLLGGCAKKNMEEKQLISNEELLDFLLSNNLLKVSNEIDIDGQLESERLLVNYFSVSPEEYFEAFKNNSKSINFFNRDIRKNELLKHGSERQNDSLLIIRTYYKDIIFKDYKNRSKFFYEGKVNQLHIVKSYEFEDSFTYFIDAKTGDIVNKLIGPLVQFDPDENLILYSDGAVFDYSQLTEVSLFEATLFGLETLLTDHNQWVVSRAFFTNENEIYYVHSAYGDGYGFRSTFAKMVIQRK